jgi:hypothetical protein
MNLVARLIGVLTAPRATFASIAAHPKVLGMLCLTVVLTAFAAALPMTTEAGKQAALDQQVAGMESFGMQVSDEMYAQMQKGTAMLPYTTAASVLVMVPIVTLIIAGILFAVFNAAMGGEARFKQLFAVIVHAGIVSTLGGLFSGLINYFRGGAGSATTLGSLLPMIDEKSFVGRLLGMTDIFVIWWLIVLAIGLAVLYRRKTQPIATTFFVIYAVIALGVAAVMSR